MDISNNTVLITGGSSGIGLELAKQLLHLGNTVIVTGRNPAKLAAVSRSLPGIHTRVCDVADPASIRAMHQPLPQEFPALNVVIHCAGIMRKINLQSPTDDLQGLTQEVETNLKGTLWVNQMFLPHLKKQPRAAIVNVSSGLAFVPMAIAPIYCATKAGLHAYTRSLRLQLKRTRVQVFELAPPGTDTSLFSGDFTKEDVGGVTPMPVETLVKHALAGLRKDTLEIRPGLSNVLKIASRIAPNFMFAQLGKSVDLMMRDH
ncbi:SDR family NAD(P)-dependent oxidoreductase [Acidovorax sp. BLS4]|uniref:SDR family oxidoreductase n=1 Tax=Acidovorax sp. BLS4 TaxID=3273430 RepID=UPI0029434919|nr:SDR family NAD(P)-dependent oxidoreductase [Paracidovorax avenae]WOI44658.1 SDR family NAD(P)-dependent oxidoreductase [Paracidovorax avenae]